MTDSLPCPSVLGILVVRIENGLSAIWLSWRLDLRDLKSLYFLLLLRKRKKNPGSAFLWEEREMLNVPE